MGATVVLVLKIMPDGNSTNLEEIEHAARKILEHDGGRSIAFEQQEIAFGLKAIIVKAAMPEEIGTDTIEHKLSAIPHVSSITVEDYRRAFG